MIRTSPTAAIVIGSGLAESLRHFPVLESIAYERIPGMSVPSVPGHDGVVKVIDIGGRSVLAFVGRSHLYEGVSTRSVRFPMDWMADQGISNVVFTNAAGGLDRLLDVGDIVQVADIIDATLWDPEITRDATSRMFDVIDPAWHARIRANCVKESLRVRDGVYVQVLGPSYETRAEIRMYRAYGAHIIGMSTAREARYAASIGMSVAAFSLVTNRLAEVDTPALDHAHVVKAGEEAADRLGRILHSTIFAL